MLTRCQVFRPISLVTAAVLLVATLGMACREGGNNAKQQRGRNDCAAQRNDRAA